MKEHVLLWKAIHELEVDQPVLAYELLGPEAIRLYLYGGGVVDYTLPPPETPTELPPAGGRKGKPAGQRRAP